MGAHVVPPALLIVSPFPTCSWGAPTVEIGEVSMSLSHVADLISLRDNLDNLTSSRRQTRNLFLFLPTSTSGASVRYDRLQGPSTNHRMKRYSGLERSIIDNFTCVKAPIAGYGSRLVSASCVSVGLVVGRWARALQRMQSWHTSGAYTRQCARLIRRQTRSVRTGVPLAGSQKPGWRMPIAKGEMSSGMRRW